MTKKLLLLFVTALFISPIYATSLQSLVATRAHHAQTSMMPTTDKSIGREEQILHALQQVLDAPLRLISWEQFEQENASSIRRHDSNIENISAFVNDLYNLDCTMFNSIFQESPLQTGRPHYSQETKDIKYIYLGEHHGTETIPSEILEVLHAVRQANPTAHILIATEFAEFDRNTKAIPLSFSTPQHAKELSVYSYHPPFYVYPKHRGWFKAATQLNIDVLALETYSYDPQKPIDIGNTLISVSADNPQAAKIVAQYQQDNNKKFSFKDSLSDFLGRSEWGIRERNQQWARYIKAVSPFYDIIITYAGKGHLSGESNNLPDLIGDPHYIEFDFETDEKIAQESANFYKSCKEIQQDQHASATGTVQMTDEQLNTLSQLYNSVPENSLHIYYAKQTPMIWKEADCQELNQLSQQHFQQNWEEGQSIHFDVYLPDINRQEYQRIIDNWERIFSYGKHALTDIKDRQTYQKYADILAKLEKSFQEIIQSQNMPIQEKLKQLKELSKTNESTADDIDQILSQQKFDRRNTLLAP